MVDSEFTQPLKLIKKWRKQNECRPNKVCYTQVFYFEHFLVLFMNKNEKMIYYNCLIISSLFWWYGNCSGNITN